MLRKTLSTKEDINISNFLNLKSLIKINAKGYKPKKAYTLKWNQIITFMETAPNYTYLAAKVIYISTYLHIYIFMYSHIYIFTFKLILYELCSV